MAYQTPTYDMIIATYLQDVRNIRPEAAVDNDSDTYVRAAATASAVEGLYHHQHWIARQILPHTADPEMLELHAGLRGLTRKAATKASGTLTVTGTPGTVVPVSLLAKCNDLTVMTTADTPIGPDGLAVVPCRAVAAGAVTTLTDAMAAVTKPPSGMDRDALLTLKGGTNTESDAELLDRLLFYLRNPPAGGNKADFERWAMEVDGITRATCYPLRRGLGTVDVLVTAGQAVPDQDLLATVAAHLATKHCVTADIQVLPPHEVVVPITVALDTATPLPEFQGRVETSLQAVFARLAPSDPVVLSKLVTVLSGLDGVRDVVIRAPATNQIMADNQWASLGPVTLEAL